MGDGVRMSTDGVRRLAISRRRFVLMLALVGGGLFAAFQQPAAAPAKPADSKPAPAQATTAPASGQPAPAKPAADAKPGQQAPAQQAATQQAVTPAGTLTVAQGIDADTL